MFKLAAFAAISAWLIYVSRASLCTPRSHGFYRFFAWEIIAVLVLLDMDVWFRDPFSRHQIVSWFLLVGSIVPLAFGLRALAAGGKPAGHREGEPQLLAFERTTMLVTTGVYRRIRHPLYSSLLLLTWGTFFKHPDRLGVLLALAATFFLVATAKADEAECERFFGAEYQAYKKRTKMFLPFIL